MLFSIIIPTCNRDSLLKKCLNCLEPSKQKIPFSEYEVIVTDDSLNSTVASEVDFIRFYTGPRKGPAANRNNGAKYANGEWLIFLDDDVIPSEDLLNIYKAAINDYPNAIAFEGSIYPDDYELMKKDLAECPINSKGGVFWSANICIKKTIFDKVNGFDEQFILAAQEDQDLYKRLINLGDVMFIEKALVKHPVRLIGLATKISNIIPGVKNWYKFELKHNQQSGQQYFKTLFNLLISYTKQMLNSIIGFKFKSFIFSFVWLFLGTSTYTYLFLKERFKIS